MAHSFTKDFIQKTNIKWYRVLLVSQVEADHIYLAHISQQSKFSRLHKFNIRLCVFPNFNSYTSFRQISVTTSCITGALWWESTVERRNPCAKGQWCRTLKYSSCWPEQGVELWYFSSCWPEQGIEQRPELLLIWSDSKLIWRQLDGLATPYWRPMGCPDPAWIMAREINGMARQLDTTLRDRLK